jgi:RsiW-degrading membrane proteinase PrsW (M82 family)
VLYVMEHGAATGWLRALTAVPCHALFGTVMGAYLAKTFHARGSTPAGWFALFMPTLWHGAYDAPLFLMEVGAPAGVCITIWLLVVALLWRTAVRQLRQLRVVQDFPAPPLLDPLHTPQVLLRRGRANTNS